ncbi:sec-independent protein translocase protein TatA [Blastococcus colisei]|uniref:Sec-independent protein translocase protein TatA n=1 Tax=Blastococcus colisei TaxID=1564162 RepID=A0A543PAT9_9ACTN|nr:Sec-independent protein translocase subunit TatA [Blastococcus colisei]TQN41204.1 sec-independent protein translocase protein TatA [Blastococcus colisei]
MNLGPMEIGLILLAILLLFGYKKLPDASRSLGRSLRIFKGEMKGMKDDDAPDGQATGAAPGRGTILPAATVPGHPADVGTSGTAAPANRTPSADVDGAR